MSLFGNRAGPIAVDFGSCGLRLMQLGGSGERLDVIAAACHSYPTPIRSFQREPDEVIEALRGLLRENRFVGKRVVSVLGERQLLIKNIRLPQMPKDEMASAVRFEARERISGLDADAEIRYITAGPVVGDAEEQQEIIVLAVCGAVVREHLDLLAAAGCESVGIDAAPCALFRPFERFLRRSVDQDHVNVFVDVGWSGSRIVISNGNHVVFARSCAIGGASFDQLVAGALAVDIKKAMELRRRASLASSETVDHDEMIDPKTAAAIDEAVVPGWEKLGHEIGLCLRYYAVTFRGARPDAVTCLGGESLNAPYIERLSETTGLRCHVGYPLRDATFAAGLPLHEGFGPMSDWTMVLGLAMKPLSCAAEAVG